MDVSGWLAIVVTVKAVVTVPTISDQVDAMSGFRTVRSSCKYLSLEHRMAVLENAPELESEQYCISNPSNAIGM